jgi:hypothetical protein
MAFSIVQARALDHGQSQSRAAKPARTGFSSVQSHGARRVRRLSPARPNAQLGRPAKGERPA